MIARTTRRAVLAAVATLTFMLAQGAEASPPPPAADEIEHLLNFVAASSCTFVRNATEYAADKAREHLASKYRFAASRIATAEDFIKYLATQSSMSGEPYHVKCAGKDALSGLWLAEELRRYRKVAHTQAAR
jgi:hypothetical protein